MWELFVPFIASVIVTILLRRLDRSNLKLSKMKKYVSKALEDFDKSVRVKEKQFQDASIDFEIQIRQGRALMQDLNNQAEIIAAKLDALKNDQTVLEKIQDDLESVITSAGSVGDQVEAIDASLEKLKSRKRELNQMETQLGRVRKEASEMVGAFSSKVKQTAEDMFKALDEKVGGIEQHYLDKEEELFAQNKIELEKFSNRLRSEMTELQTDLTSSVDLILKDTHEKIDSYGDKIDQMERSIINTQEKAENEFHNLREEALRYTTDLDGQFMKLTGQIKKTTDDLNGIRENLYKELYSESQKVRAEIQEFNLDAIAKKDEIVNAARREAEGIQKQIEEFQARYLESENKLFKEADARNSELVAKLDAFEEDFNRIQAENIADMENRLTAVRNEHAGELQKMTAKLSEEAGQKQRQTADKLGVLKAELETAWREMHDARFTELNHLGNRIDKMDSAFEQGREKWEQIAQSTENNLNHNAQELLAAQSREYERAQSGLRESMEEQLAEAGDRFKDWRREMQTGGDETIKLLKTQSAEALEKISSETKKASAELEGAVSRLVNEKEARLDEFRQETQVWKKSLLEDTEGILRDMEKTGQMLEDNNRKLAQEMENELRAYGEEVVNRYTQDTDNRFEQSVRGFDIKIEGLTSRVQTSMESIEDRVQQNKADLLEELGGVDRTVRENLKDIQKAKSEIFTELRNETTALQGTLNDLKSEVTEYQTVARVFTDAEKLAKDLDNKILELKNNMQNVLHENDKVDEFLERVSHLKELRQELEAEIKKIDKRKSVIDEFENQIGAILNLSDQVAAKMEGIEDNREKMETLERGIVRFEEQFRVIDQKFEELLETRTDLESTQRVIREADANTGRLTQRLHSMEGQLEKVNKKATGLNAYLKGIESKSLVLTSREEEIKAVEHKFEEIEDLLADLNERQEQIILMSQRTEKMKSWMEQKKNELQELGFEAESKMTRLSEFLDSVESTGSVLTKEVRGPLPNSVQAKKETILMLAQNRNWSVDEIAKYLKVEKSTVETILATGAI